MEEAMLPGAGQSEMVDMASDLIESFRRDYPHMHELTTEHVLHDGYSFGSSFEFGLDLILDGLERASHTGALAGPTTNQ
jgi:hypothetical protein